MSRSIWFYMDSVPFTPSVIDGTASLGGSESACKGTAEALAARGHDVKIFATNLEQTTEHAGVPWYPADLLSETLRFAAPDVFCALRTTQPFINQIDARLNVLWCQDLFVPPHGEAILPGLAQVDHLAFVSAFHKRQWCDLHPFLEPMAWVTRNGIDPSLLPEPYPEKIPHRFIHISRPERGLDPLLAMWPAIRAQWPDATLAIARYQSMYDGEGSNVARMCDSFDRKTEKVEHAVGGIVRLGALGKADLYREIAQAELMLYPGIASFAETNCIAATEAQACGTPLIASARGAIPETLHPDAGICVPGDADTEEYHAQFLDAMQAALEPDTHARMVEAGRTWAARSTFDTIAEEWESWITERFETRYQTQTMGILRQLLHWDRHAIAKVVCADILDRPDDFTDDERQDAIEADAFCDRVIRQEEQTAAQYAAHAVANVEAEAQANVRLQVCATTIAKATPERVLDVACGNGTFAYLLAGHLPGVTIDCYDYSDGVLELARNALASLDGDAGSGATFQQAAFQDIPPREGGYDAVFCGEFLEHVEKPWELLDQLEAYASDDGVIMLTTPCGPFAEMLPEGMPCQRGHVHSFTVRDICEMCQDKRDFQWRYQYAGDSHRGSACGYWIFSYQKGGGPARELDYAREALTTRPYQRLGVAMIMKNEADWIRRCIRSLYGVVDRVTIYDTGSTDGSIEIAEGLGATVIRGEWPNHFAEARNRSLDAVEPDAEWVLWIDADEILENKLPLRRFITGAGPFNAYALHQVHVSPDVPTYDDKPCRLFRTGKGVRFFGHVHEQPETAPDKGIHPSLDLSDPHAPRIIHYGYGSESIRRGKLTQRNLHLLRNELKSENPRELAYVLAIRDYCNFALFAIERDGGVTAYSQNAYHKAIRVFRDRFLDPSAQYHDLAYPYYQSALEALGMGVTAKWAFAAGAGRGFKGAPQPEILRAWDADELQAEIAYRIQTWCKPLSPHPVQTEPLSAEVST